MLNDAETSATVNVVHNVNIPLTGGHIHRAPAGVNGPIIFPFPSPASPIGPLVWAIPAADVANLKAAGLYVNIHTTVNPGGAIRDQLRRFSFVPNATGGAQAAVAGVLDVAATHNADLDSVMVGLVMGTSAARASALSELTGNTIYAQGRQAVEAMATTQDSLFERAEDAGPDGRLGGFVIVGKGFGARKGNEFQSASKVSQPFLVTGLDIPVGEGASLGLAFGLADGKDKFKDGVGQTDAKTTSLSAYVSAGGDAIRVTGLIGYGWNEYETTRSLASLGRRATSEHDGSVWAIGAKASMPMSLGGGAVTPYAAVDYQSASVDAYQEAGASSLGLTVPKHKSKNAGLELGATALVGDTAATHGRLQLGYRMVLDDARDTLAVSLIGSPATFPVEVLSQGASAIRASASVVGRLAPGATLSAGYRGLFSQRTDNHAVEVRLTVRM